jgi:hypothetical protein
MLMSLSCGTLHSSIWIVPGHSHTPGYGQYEDVEIMADNSSNDSYFVKRQAGQDFESAHRNAFWKKVLSWFSQRQNDLISFDDFRGQIDMQGEHWIGLREVPIEQIIGSVGRYQDFDRAFLPRRTNTRSRWVSIDEAHIQDISLPPIELYKVGSAYFVKDGNHRVSVAREKGQVFIDAYVIEIDVNVPVTPETNIDELILMRERGNFIRTTHLDQLRPDAVIELTLPGQYENLLEHIVVHRWFLGLKDKQPVPLAESVTSWYDTVYMPLVEIIRQQAIMKEFPGRTEADLYLWIIEHHWYMIQAEQAAREGIGEEVSLEEAARHFAEVYSRRPGRKLAFFLKRAAQTLTGGIEQVLDSFMPGSDPGGDKEGG